MVVFHFTSIKVLFLLQTKFVKFDVVIQPEKIEILFQFEKIEVINLKNPYCADGDPQYTPAGCFDTHVMGEEGEKSNCLRNKEERQIMPNIVATMFCLQRIRAAHTLY